MFTFEEWNQYGSIQMAHIKVPEELGWRNLHKMCSLDEAEEWHG